MASAFKPFTGGNGHTITAEERANAQGVNAVSTRLFDRVTNYHAAIGKGVPPADLRALEGHLIAEGTTLFHRKEFEECLNVFTHVLAITDKTRSSKDVSVRGAIIYNIASCLHQLGEIEAAQVYYQQAMQAFEVGSASMGPVEKLVYGSANQRRIDFVRERFVEISWGQKPDGDEYLDVNGRKKQLPSAVVRDAVGNEVHGSSALALGMRPIPSAGGRPVSADVRTYQQARISQGYAPARNSAAATAGDDDDDML